MATDWSLKGTYFESCNCDVVCPCIFLHPPTQGFCEAFPAWHIDEGYLGDTRLDGLNVAAWLHAPGALTDGNWKLALYIDEQADEAQKDALTQIYGGQVGGHPAVIASFVGEVMGVKSVPIEYRVEGRQRTLRIPGVGEAEMEAINGENDNEVTVQNHPLAVCPGFPHVVNETRKLDYKDYGHEQSVSGTSGLSASFAYQPD